MIELPRHVCILGQHYAIEVVDHPTAALDPDSAESHSALGTCDRTGNRIILRGTLGDDKARETLLHETLHAIVGTTRMELWQGDDEEKVVAQLAPVLLDVLRSNPRLVDALLAPR